jgi:IS1 family transposase
VIEELKKDRHLDPVNRPLLGQLKPTTVNVAKYVEEAEADEMWSFVRCKQQERWLWYAIDHQTGQVLAYVLADHKDQALVKLKALLEPFGVQIFYTDGWGAYARLFDEDHPVLGKWNTQKNERKHLTLRTRIKRTPLAERSSIAHKTICFSKSEWLHDIVIGLFINRYEFGRAV